MPTTSPTVSPVITTRKLCRRFGDVIAVDNLDLTVPAGAFFGFLGPNGAGKSTTVKMLSGLLAPSAGEVRILDLDLTDPEQALAAKRRIGVVPENLALFDNLTALEQLIFIGRIYGLPLPTVHDRAAELLAVTGLAADADKLTVEFSHGMRKKLALAAALLPDPEVLFLDEPFEGVDPIASRTLREILARTVARGATVFLTSHILEIVERLCTEVAIIAQGRLVHCGTMAALREQGTTLEDRFLAAVGGERTHGHELSWLED